MAHDGMNMPPGPMSDMNSNGMSTMHTSFFWGKEVIIFFSGWPDGSLGMYILALLFVFLLAAGVEVLSISPSVKTTSKPAVAGLIQASVYAIQMALTYVVMLSVMSYNIGIFIVAVFGHAVGHFLVKFYALARAAPAEDLAPKVSSNFTPSQGRRPL